MSEGAHNFVMDDAEEVARGLEAQFAEAQRRADQAAVLRDRIAAVVGVARSRDRQVEARVNASGTVLSLRIAEDAADGSMAELAGSVQATIAEAQRVAGQQAVALMGEVFGEESAVTERLRAEVDQRSAGLGASGFGGGPTR